MQSEKERVALGSIAVSAALTVGKAVVGVLSGSLALLSEAAHSLIDFFATVMTYFAVRISGKPADAEHHYGHGKVESVTALAETALLFLLSGVVIWEAATPLRRPYGRSASLAFRSWSIFSERGCSTAWRMKQRARRWRQMPCTSAPTCGRRSQC
jgi:cation diffusion facilitator family transporter